MMPGAGGEAGGKFQLPNIFTWDTTNIGINHKDDYTLMEYFDKEIKSVKRIIQHIKDICKQITPHTAPRHLSEKFLIQVRLPPAGVRMLGCGLRPPQGQIMGCDVRPLQALRLMSALGGGRGVSSSYILIWEYTTF